MKYKANPVVVDAFKIVDLGDESQDFDYCLTLENGEQVIAGLDKYIRHHPVVGDYWVIQSEGYTYLNPADVFLRKYSPQEE